MLPKISLFLRKKIPTYLSEKKFQTSISPSKGGIFFGGKFLDPVNKKSKLRIPKF
jgi:hypothetical protein